jgi:hypothetical protein
MSAREFLRHNRWQKGLSLLLATLIWFTVRQSLEHGGGPLVVPDGKKLTFEHLPIRTLGTALDPGLFRVSPTEVTVVLQGRPENLSRLRPSDVDVYVKLTEIPLTNSFRRSIRVHAPGAQVSSVSPQEVLIERELPTDKSPAPKP